MSLQRISDASGPASRSSPGSTFEMTPLSAAPALSHAITPSGRAVNPWWIGLTLTIATFMELLDTSIANVSLPHIAGGLGTSLDNGEPPRLKTYCSRVASESQGRCRASQNTCRKRFERVRG